MRKVWATCSASLYLLNELGEYFEGQVVPSQWNHLMDWMAGAQPASSRPGTSGGQRPVSSSSAFNPTSSFQRLSLHARQDESLPPTQTHDPASLSAAHHSLLTALSNGLLLTDVEFTRNLHTLLRSIDELVAQILRLQTIERNLDLEEDEGVVDALANHVEDHKKCSVELDRARKKVDSGSKTVVGRLKVLGEHERESSAGLVPTGGSGGANEYVPKQIGGKLENLLMKLEFGKGDEGVVASLDDD
jgi:hypothetical protein